MRDVKVSDSTLDDIIECCTDAQEEFLNDLLLQSTLDGDYTVYTKLTGIKPELVPEDLPIPDSNIVPHGRYSATFDLPDLSYFDADARDSIYARLVQNHVIYKILAPVLRKENPSAYYTYFKDMIEPSTEEDAKDDFSIVKRLADGEPIRPLLRCGAREALGVLLQQHTDEIISHIKIDEDFDFNKGARVHIKYIVAADGRLDVITAGKKYLEQYTQGMTITLPNAAKKDLKELAEQVEGSEISDDDINDVKNKDNPIYNGLETLIIRNLLATKHPETSRFYTVDDETGCAHLTEKGYETFKTFLKKSISKVSEEIRYLPDIDEGGLLRIVCDVDDSGVSNVKLNRVTFDPDRRSHIRTKLPDVERLSEDEVGEAYEDDARTHAIEMMAAIMEASDPDNFKKYFEACHIYRDEGRRESYRFTDAGREKFIGLGKLYDKFTDAVTEGMERLEETMKHPFFLELKSEEPDSAKPSVKAKKTYLNYEDKHSLELKIPAAEKLDRVALSEISKIVVGEVIYSLIAKDMSDKEHPKFDRFYTYDKEKDTYWLTEEGAKNLGGLIENLSSELALLTLQARAFTPEHLSGFGMQLKYTLNPDDTFGEIQHETYR